MLSNCNALKKDLESQRPVMGDSLVKLVGLNADGRQGWVQTKVRKRKEAEWETEERDRK